MSVKNPLLHASREPSWCASVVAKDDHPSNKNLTMGKLPDLAATCIGFLRDAAGWTTKNGPCMWVWQHLHSVWIPPQVFIQRQRARYGQSQNLPKPSKSGEVISPPSRSKKFFTGLMAPQGPPWPAMAHDGPPATREATRLHETWEAPSQFLHLFRPPPPAGSMGHNFGSRGWKDSPLCCKDQGLVPQLPRIHHCSFKLHQVSASQWF